MVVLRSKVNVVDTLWLLSTWVLTISSALLCSGARELSLIWCFNLGCCVFSFQARRALRRYGPKAGWVARCRKVGRRRVKRQRRNNQARLRWWTLVRQMHSQQRRRFCGGGPRPQDKELLAGLLVSVLGDAVWVEQLLAQDWVQTWQGWDEMADQETDAVAMQCAERFLQIVGANVSLRRQSDDERLQDLAAHGLFLQTAASHGVNNCLIDSLLLTLTAEDLIPNGQRYSKAERKRLCARCRAHLGQQYGTPEGTYLDGHRDAPRILDFFLRQQWQQDVSVRVHFYDSLNAQNSW